MYCKIHNGTLRSSLKLIRKNRKETFKRFATWIYQVTILIKVNQKS